MWQDWVLMIGGIGLSVALLPSLFSEHKPHLSTSQLTGYILLAFAISYGTLDLYLATFSAAICAMLWFILAIQVSRRKIGSHHS